MYWKKDTMRRGFVDLRGKRDSDYVIPETIYESPGNDDIWTAFLLL